MGSTRSPAGFFLILVFAFFVSLFYMKQLLKDENIRYVLNLETINLKMVDKS